MTRDLFVCGSALMIILLASGCQSRIQVIQSLSACGQAPNTGIRGGQNGSSGGSPWFASIKIFGSFSCGGSLINNQWVLTTASCNARFFPSNTTVSLGSQNQWGSNPNEVTVGIQSVVTHPSYDYATNNNDIALLKLSSPVNFTDYIYPVCLASAGSTFFSGVNSVVTGFGSSQPGSYFAPQILQETNVSIVGNNKCRCAYPQLTDNMICAGLSGGGPDLCQGRTGGPMVTNNGAIWVQSGIVSFAYNCARPNTPGGFTRVSQYQEWISNVTGASQPGFVTYTSPGVDSNLNYQCPNITFTTNTTSRPYPEGPRWDGSVFGSGERVVHFSHFSPLGLLVVSLYVLARDA